MVRSSDASSASRAACPRADFSGGGLPRHAVRTPHFGPEGGSGALCGGRRRSGAEQRQRRRENPAERRCCACPPAGARGGGGGGGLRRRGARAARGLPRRHPSPGARGASRARRGGRGRHHICTWRARSADGFWCGIVASVWSFEMHVSGFWSRIDRTNGNADWSRGQTHFFRRSINPKIQVHILVPCGDSIDDRHHQWHSGDQQARHCHKPSTTHPPTAGRTSGEGKGFQRGSGLSNGLVGVHGGVQLTLR